MRPQTEIEEDVRRLSVAWRRDEAISSLLKDASTLSGAVVVEVAMRARALTLQRAVSESLKTLQDSVEQLETVARYHAQFIQHLQKCVGELEPVTVSEQAQQANAASARAISLSGQMKVQA